MKYLADDIWKTLLRKNKHNAVPWALRSQQGCLRGLGFHLGPLLQGSCAVI
jgi:hypothetical protein